MNHYPDPGYPDYHPLGHPQSLLLGTPDKRRVVRSQFLAVYRVRLSDNRETVVKYPRKFFGPILERTGSVRTVTGRVTRARTLP